MPSVTMENVNGKYSTLLLLLLLLIIVFAITGQTKFLTQYAYFLCSLYRGARGDYCGHNSDCQGDMKCHGVTDSANM